MSIQKNISATLRAAMAEKLGIIPAKLISGADMPVEMYKLEAQRKTTHPLPEPAIGASLRLTRELFLLSHKLSALETEEKTDE